MDLLEISFKECLLLGRRAERRCACMFRFLAGRLGPSEGQLVRKLLALAVEEEAHEAAVARIDGRVDYPLTWHLDEDSINRALEELFPTLFSRREEGDTLDAATVLSLVRSVEEESHRFYRDLGALAGDDGVRAVIRELEEQEASHRDVLE